MAFEAQADLPPFPKVGVRYSETESNVTQIQAEGEEDQEIMDPDHPLLARVQIAIFEQLSRHEEKLTLEVRESEEIAQKMIKKREDVGVELYALQQSLARLQANYEAIELGHDAAKRSRNESERVLKHAKIDFKREKEKQMQYSRNIDDHQLEMEKIARTLKQVDLYNEELRSKILVAKRTTLKAERDILQKEIEKKRQDFHIDQLGVQLQNLKLKKETYDSQYNIQRQETHAAVSTLQEACSEMEGIQYEKKQLLNQWNSSLLALKKRDSLKEEIESAISLSKGEISQINLEISGLNRSLVVARENGHGLIEFRTKLELEIQAIEQKLGEKGVEKSELSQTFNSYTKAIGQIEHNLSSCGQEQAMMQQEVNGVDKEAAQTTLKIQKMEREISETLKTQSSHKEGASATVRDGSKLRLAMYEKENQVVAHQNEISILELEGIKAEARIGQMRQEVVKVVAAIEEQNAVICRYEQEMKCNEDSLSKKASEIDTLNKKFDQMTSANVESHMGPLEATIHNLTKSINSKESECLQLQQYWLQAQNELVSMTKVSLIEKDEIQDLTMRQTVMNRKKLVLNSAFETEEKQMKDHCRNISKIQFDMVKMNSILTSQSRKYDILEEKNLEIELRFRNKLKDAELESISLERNLIRLHHEKEEALVGLIEGEKQIMLWEKKIQLAKETRAALDPNVGSSEIREMGLEIHRMTLRYTTLLKQQEKMIGEMEKSVHRRESISLKYY